MRAGPNLFNIVEGAHFGPEQVNHHVAGIHQHPVRLRHAFDAHLFDARVLQLAQRVIRHGAAMAPAWRAERPDATTSMSAKEDLPRMSMARMSSALSSSSDVSTRRVAVSTSIPSAGRSGARSGLPAWVAAGARFSSGDRSKFLL